MAVDRGPGVHFFDLSAGGELGRLIREKDWATTSLGPRQAWPRSLSNHVSMILELPSAAIVFWGPDQIQLYNDGYAVIMGPRHPQHLGSSFRECWPEAYESIHPWMERVLRDGETVEVVRTLVPLTRFGFTEEAYFTFSFSPLRDDQGEIAGILQLVTEVTEAVLGERRAAVLHELSKSAVSAKTTTDAARLAAEVLGKSTDDVPFCLIYVAHEQERSKLALCGWTGLPDDHRPFPAELDLAPIAVAAIPELVATVRERRVVRIEDLATRFASLPARLAFASPVTAADGSIVAVLVVGVNPRLAFDGHYQSFLQLVSAQLATSLGAARAYDDERKRAEALAELDRAKTEFFGNVSHEFRTPLTLILGPLEEALGDPSKPVQGEVLEAVHRNALRLLRLVNTLLDFARLEADRLTSALEPTDLPVLTAGLVGSFQSLLDTAGLALQVDCPRMAEPVYVDRAQWEKIVLNLVSNAFKFTFEGEIGVRLREHDGHVHLSVSDTGTGIPPEELPRIFDRFHRVKGARSRSFEGTGIGLALVQDLARRHGGSVRVESVLGEGTTFVVTIPKRTEQAAGDPVPPPLATAAASATPYVLEAERWSVRGGDPPKPAQAAAAAAGPSAPDTRAHILVADDNADMREHLFRLLSPKWSVELAEDGQAALEAARRRLPDLVLSDVMMPRLDGVGLVNALRADPRTSTVPIVLLSARAGEEAVIGGFDTGADDYLVKPFAARELLARVHSHLQMAQLRRAWARELEHANAELEAFSYSVSHDLRTPLRAIDGFSHELLTEHAHQLDDEGRRYLERVRMATQRMAKLIDDLLDLSRVTRAKVAREPADLSEIAKKIADDLAERDPKRKVVLVIADGLVTSADPRLVTVVLENLLGNAWKFTGKKPGASITVASECRNGETVFFVRDDGAGFDMEYAKKLFTPFQRLHSHSEFEGTGIGLATVRRIVTRHGGRIWADAAPGQGATFYFTLDGRA